MSQDSIKQGFNQETYEIPIFRSLTPKIHGTEYMIPTEIMEMGMKLTFIITDRGRVSLGKPQSHIRVTLGVVYPPPGKKYLDVAMYM